MEMISGIAAPPVVPTDVSTAPRDQLPQAAAPPARTNAELWLEVLAVLAVGVIPYCTSVLLDNSSNRQMGPLIALAIRSACHIYVTIYFIHLSREPWKRFGLSRFCANDVILAIVTLLVARIVLTFSWFILPEDQEFDVQPAFQTGWELSVLIVCDLFNGFAEEIVTRAYLITRFEQLLKSQWKAVILASFLFAFYHLYQGIGGAFDALLFGLAYSIAFLLFRTIWPLAIGHACSNIFSELLIYGQ